MRLTSRGGGWVVSVGVPELLHTRELGLDEGAAVGLVLPDDLSLEALEAVRRKRGGRLSLT